MARSSPKAKSPSASQIERFKETARQLGADESEAAFEAKLKAIATANLAEKKAPPKSKRTA